MSRVLNAYRCLVEGQRESADRFAAQTMEVVEALAEERTMYREALEMVVAQGPPLDLWASQEAADCVRRVLAWDQPVPA